MKRGRRKDKERREGGRKGKEARRGKGLDVTVLQARKKRTQPNIKIFTLFYTQFQLR